MKRKSNKNFAIARLKKEKNKMHKLLTKPKNNPAGR